MTAAAPLPPVLVEVVEVVEVDEPSPEDFEPPQATRPPKIRMVEVEVGAA